MKYLIYLAEVDGFEILAIIKGEVRAKAIHAMMQTGDERIQINTLDTFDFGGRSYIESFIY